MTTGEKIRAARKAAGMTQAELAEKLGICSANVSAVEANTRRPKLETLKRYANALGVDVQELTGGLKLPPRVEDITPQLVVEALTEWAKIHIIDAALADAYYNSKCAIALFDAAEIIKAVFPDDFLKGENK